MMSLEVVATVYFIVGFVAAMVYLSVRFFRR